MGRKVWRMKRTQGSFSSRAVRGLRRLGPVICVLTVAACTETDPRMERAVRDSAGVVIVESHVPRWTDGSAWSLEGEPLLEIGVVEGAAEYQFSGIAGALRTPDGRIVVADGGSQEIRLFDGEGRFLATRGGRGGAPGEYQQIVSIGYGPEDSIWVFDFGARRFTVLSADGRLGRTWNIGGALSAVGAVGRLADGTFVVREFWGSGSHSAEVRSGLGRDPAAVARFSANGAEFDTIGVFPGREVYIGSEDGRAVMSTPLFARNANAAVSGNELFFGDQESFEIRLYSVDGTLRRSIRLPGVDLRISDDDIQRAIEQQLAGQPSERHAMLRSHYETMDIPETKPAYGRLLVDVQKNLWVGEYVPYPHQPIAWQVISEDGSWLGEVRVPERFQVHQIGGDWVLGVWRDEIDVEHVRLYRLDKSGTSTP